MTTPTLTTPPGAPSRLTGASTFSADMDAFLAWMVVFEPELVAMIAWVLATAAEVDTCSADAQIAAEAAAAASGASKWVSGSFDEGDVVWSPTDYYIYRNKAGAGGTTDPAADSTNWTLVSFPAAVASAAEIRAGSSSTAPYTPAGVIAALAPVTLTDGATITPDMSTFINAQVTLGGNRTLANPTVAAADVGKSGWIKVIQDGTGSRTLAYGSYWLFASGTDFVLGTAASSTDYLFYVIESTTRIVIVGSLRGVA